MIEEEARAQQLVELHLRLEEKAAAAIIQHRKPFLVLHPGAPPPTPLHHHHHHHHTPAHPHPCTHSSLHLPVISMYLRALRIQASTSRSPANIPALPGW